jgi:hypothetical protein
MKKPKKYLFVINRSIQNLINHSIQKIGSVLSRHLISCTEKFKHFF